MIEIKNQIGELPDTKKKKFMESFGLSAYDSDTLLYNPDMARYFEKVVQYTPYYKIAANIFITDIMRMNKDEFFCPITAENLAKLATLFGEQVINSSTLKKLFKRMWQEDIDPLETVEKEGLAQINDRTVLSEVVDEVLKKSEKLVKDYKDGKEKAFEAIIGTAMGKTGGKANPVILTEILNNKIKGEE